MPLSSQKYTITVHIYANQFVFLSQYFCSQVLIFIAQIQSQMKFFV